VLLLAGALDSKYSADLSQIAALIPDARFDLCPDAGHNLHLENPDWLLEKLADFLNQCTG
jgi:pimeloyl-ACP methyl ester carboxylesterase